MTAEDGWTHVTPQPNCPSPCHKEGPGLHLEGNVYTVTTKTGGRVDSCRLHMRAQLIFKCIAVRTDGGLASFITKLCERITVPRDVMNKVIRGPLPPCSPALCTTLHPSTPTSPNSKEREEWNSALHVWTLTCSPLFSAINKGPLGGKSEFL